MCSTISSGFYTIIPVSIKNDNIYLRSLILLFLRSSALLFSIFLVKIKKNITSNDVSQIIPLQSCIFILIDFFIRNGLIQIINYRTLDWELKWQCYWSCQEYSRAKYCSCARKLSARLFCAYHKKSDCKYFFGNQWTVVYIERRYCSPRFRSFKHKTYCWKIQRKDEHICYWQYICAECCFWSKYADALSKNRNAFLIQPSSSKVKEIDFVGVRREERIYVQVCVELPTGSTRETDTLIKIKDHYHRYVSLNFFSGFNNTEARQIMSVVCPLKLQKDA